jgi:hypothetical protein
MHRAPQVLGPETMHREYVAEGVREAVQRSWLTGKWKAKKEKLSS